MNIAEPSPASVSPPRRSAARSDETATTDAIAAFPEACMATRVPIVRRWTAARCASSRATAVVVEGGAGGHRAGRHR